MLGGVLVLGGGGVHGRFDSCLLRACTLIIGWKCARTIVLLCRKLYSLHCNIRCTESVYTFNKRFACDILSPSFFFSSKGKCIFKKTNSKQFIFHLFL